MLRKCIAAAAALLLLLVGCQPRPSSIDGSYVAQPNRTPPPTSTPTAQASAEPGTTPDSDDPLAAWRGEKCLQDTVVIQPDVEAFPILLAKWRQPDWDKVIDFALADMPEGAEVLQEGDAPVNGALSGDFRLQAIYDTAYGEEGVYLNAFATDSHYGVSKQFSITDSGYNEYLTFYFFYDGNGNYVMEPATGDSGVRYTPAQAAGMFEAMYADWGADLSSMEALPMLMHSSIPYEYLESIDGGPAELYGKYWNKKPHYLLHYKHLLSGIPVVDVPIIPISLAQGESKLLPGNYTTAIINDLGIREVRSTQYEIDEVLQEDASIKTLEEIMSTNINVILQSYRELSVERIELMLAPVYDPALPDDRYRLVPAWCFLTEDYRSMHGLLFFDATTGLQIK